MFEKMLPAYDCIRKRSMPVAHRGGDDVQKS